MTICNEQALLFKDRKLLPNLKLETASSCEKFSHFAGTFSLLPSVNPLMLNQKKSFGRKSFLQTQINNIFRNFSVVSSCACSNNTRAWGSGGRCSYINSHRHLYSDFRQDKEQGEAISVLLKPISQINTSICCRKYRSVVRRPKNPQPLKYTFSLSSHPT